MPVSMAIVDKDMQTCTKKVGASGMQSVELSHDQSDTDKFGEGCDTQCQ
jgi:hypothetical protein